MSAMSYPAIGVATGSTGRVDVVDGGMVSGRSGGGAGGVVFVVDVVDATVAGGAGVSAGTGLAGAPR